jgi:hypothetical protein
VSTYATNEVCYCPSDEQLPGVIKALDLCCFAGLGVMFVLAILAFGGNQKQLAEFVGDFAGDEQGIGVPAVEPAKGD